MHKYGISMKCVACPQKCRHISDNNQTMLPKGCVIEYCSIQAKACNFFIKHLVPNPLARLKPSINTVTDTLLYDLLKLMRRCMYTTRAEVLGLCEKGIPSYCSSCIANTTRVVQARVLVPPVPPHECLSPMKIA